MHLPTSFERYRCELNRKKSKFERYGLISTVIPLVVGVTPLKFCSESSDTHFLRIASEVVGETGLESGGRPKAMADRPLATVIGSAFKSGSVTPPKSSSMFSNTTTSVRPSPNPPPSLSRADSVTISNDLPQSLTLLPKCVKIRASVSLRFKFETVFLLAAVVPCLAGEKAWIEVCSPHFRVLTNSSQSEARHVAHEFEQMRSVFAEQNPQFRLEGGAPLTIFAAEDEPTAKMLEPFLWKAKGEKPAGVYHHAWEREYVMVRMDAWNRGAHEVVYHEYTHSILHRNFHWIPVWLDEGMADLYGFSRFEGSRILVGAPPARYRMVAGQALIPIDILISVDQGSPYYRDWDKVYRFYAESWGLVHFLMFDPGHGSGQETERLFGSAATGGRIEEGLPAGGWRFQGD